MTGGPVKHGHQHCPGGPDPVPCIGNTPWIAANGEFDSDGDVNPAVNAVWTELFLDENPATANYFDYTVNAGGGLGGLDAYGLRLRSPGVYTYSIMWQTNDLAAGTTYDLISSLRITAGSNPYPNWFNTGFASGYFSWQRSVRADAAGQISLLDSVTVPVQFATPGVASTGQIALGNDPADASSWTVRIWIARLGGLTWGESDFTNPTEPAS